MLSCGTYDVIKSHFYHYKIKHSKDVSCTYCISPKLASYVYDTKSLLRLCYNLGHFMIWVIPCLLTCRQRKWTRSTPSLSGWSGKRLNPEVRGTTAWAKDKRKSIFKSQRSFKFFFFFCYSWINSYELFLWILDRNLFCDVQEGGGQDIQCTYVFCIF